MYQNIRKVILYLLAGNFKEVVLITGSLAAGLPLPVFPAQILWVNIVEEAFPTMALAFDKGDKENMTDPPRKKDQPLLDTQMRTMVVMKSILENVALFSIFVYFLKSTGDLALTRTIVFVGLGVDALFAIFSIRSLRHMVWRIPILNNMYVVGAVALGWVLLLGAVYFPPLQTLLHTSPLQWQHWAILVGFGLFNVLLIETVKWIFLVKQNGRTHAGAPVNS